MTRTRTIALFVPLLAATLAACGGDESTNPQPEDPVFPADFRQSFTHVRALSAPRFSSEHDGHYFEVFCSPADAGAYDAFQVPLPDGTTLVKVLYNDPGGTIVSSYAAMQKRAGIAPATNDWYWQNVDKDRNVVESGQVTACISCHTTNSDCLGRDLVCTDLDP